MNKIEKLIINTEFFLQCSGSCSGCFLTEEERQSENTYYENIFNGLKKISANYIETEIDFLVIGFGRGNILNLNKEGVDKLLYLITWCKENFNYNDIIFEISTSMIGKLDAQIEMAKYIVEKESKAYFNMVINSEITSKSFWKNVGRFHDEMAKFRTEKYNLIDGNADILVLNVNPQKLPDLNELELFTKDYLSPVNISIFPFTNIGIVSDKDVEKLKEWSIDLWNKFHKKDLNIKNFLFGLNAINIEDKLENYQEYMLNTFKSYIFIDKSGTITSGSLSIMGEVDKIRLMDKFEIDISVEDGLKNMFKNKHCRKCEYQKQCLLSGAYLNLMANNKILIENKNQACLSGYQELFRLSLT